MITVIIQQSNFSLSTYSEPEDIDLWTGGLSERPLHGSMVGETFGCLLAQQFRDLRFGDRFWYENGGWPSAFTLGMYSQKLFNRSRTQF
jgi:hypothetical protein